MPSHVIGIDPSLTGTGFYSFAVDPRIEKKFNRLETSCLVKSKPPQEKTPNTEIDRLLTIKKQVVEFLHVNVRDLLPDQKKPDIVLIEGIAFSARNTTALAQLAGLNYLIREHLRLEKIPFVIVAPTTLKKFISGKGNGEKNLMLLETYKHYGRTFTNDNEMDAHGLAQIGLALRGEHEKPLTVSQMEVVLLLTAQYAKKENPSTKKNAL